jgi:ribosomal protein L14E/L6E/L27E
MGKSLDEYRVGQVVVSKRGKDAGHTYVIVGFSGDDRLALADARKFNVGRPKSKNPAHVQSTPHVVEELAASVQAGKKIDHGEFCRFLSILGLFQKAGSEKAADASK